MKIVVGVRFRRRNRPIFTQHLFRLLASPGRCHVLWHESLFRRVSCNFFG
jgi:hypothetical protein